MSVESAVSLITGAGGAMGVMVIFLVLILSGKLHTDTDYQRVEKALEYEQQARAETAKALAAAAERANSAIRASELIADAFASSPRRRGNVP